MKIHTNNMIAGDIGSCVPAGTRVVDFSEASSRSHDRAYNVRLSGSARGTMRGLSHKAATYEEWGYFIAAMFRLDPDAKIGIYKTLDDFNSKTDFQFTDANDNFDVVTGYEWYAEWPGRHPEF